MSQFFKTEPLAAVLKVALQGAQVEAETLERWLGQGRIDGKWGKDAQIQDGWASRCNLPLGKLVSIVSWNCNTTVFFLLHSCACCLMNCGHSFLLKSFYNECCNGLTKASQIVSIFSYLNGLKAHSHPEAISSLTLWIQSSPMFSDTKRAHLISFYRHSLSEGELCIIYHNEL